MAQKSSLHDRVLRLPYPTSSSGVPLTAQMARENQVFIETFHNNVWMQEFNDFTAVPRPGHISSGKPAQVQLNSHKVKAFPNADIFQYDVSLAFASELSLLIILGRHWKWC